MTTIITSFPGEKVDKHLKTYGHLPGDKHCCARETFDETREWFKQHLNNLFKEKTREKQLILAESGHIGIPILFEAIEIEDLINKI